VIGIRAVIGVTGVNATDNPAPGVPVARALRHESSFAGTIVGLGYDPLDPGFYADGLFNGGAILPYPSSGLDAFTHSLREAVQAFGLEILIPTLDSELRHVVKLEAELRALGVSTFVPTLEAIDRASKPQLPRLGADCGVAVPESESLVTPEGLPRVLEAFGLPVVVKGLYYGAHVVNNVADATASFQYFASTWGVPVVVQRFVAGDEFNVCALGDGRGNMMGAVAMRKLALTDKGKGWAGVTVANPALLAAAERVVGALAWRGPLELEFVGARESGTFHLIEVNPRFPAWVYLTAAAGQNLPYVCALAALGLPAPAVLPPYDAGRMFVRISLDQVADMNRFAQLSSTGMLRSEPREGE
jgi:carbamoyl-phosphate synthase large subunit